MGAEIARLPRLLPASPEHRSLVMEILHECILKRPLYGDLCSLYLEQLLIPLAAASYRAGRGVSRDPRIARRPEGPLAEACAYIDCHLGEDLSSDTLCEACRVNARQLNSLFKKTFNQSTIEYIGNRRLARARELLCFSRDPSPGSPSPRVLNPSTISAAFSRKRREFPPASTKSASPAP